MALFDIKFNIKLNLFDCKTKELMRAYSWVSATDGQQRKVCRPCTGARREGLERVRGEESLAGEEKPSRESFADASLRGLAQPGDEMLSDMLGRKGPGGEPLEAKELQRGLALAKE